VLLYLVGATFAFLGIRATGVDTLSWRQVAWPRAWKEISQERSNYFYRRALQACARQDFPAAYQSMVTAVVQDPHNYAARLLLAQYAAYAGESLGSDRLFGLLDTGFPEQRERTAITYHDTLLAVGRYQVLARHCLRQAQEGSACSAWVNGLLLAMNLGRLGPAFLAENQADVTQLGAHAGRLIQAVAAWSAGDVAASVAALR
jgi:hypothetical protein